LFNLEEFDIKLETKSVGRNFIYSEEISSTNLYLMQDEGTLNHGSVILSEVQLEGKGRLTRQWQSNKSDNLTFSILLTKNLSKLSPNHINLAASLAVATAIENLYQLKTDLKWPNDVLVKAKKISGILLESSSKGSVIEKLVIGIGVNVNQTKFLGDFKIRPTSIKFEMRREINRERLLSEILNVFENLIYKSKEASKTILEEWRNKCRMIGEPIRLIIGEEKKNGIFYDLDANGFLILKSGDKIEKITNGDISVV